MEKLIIAGNYSTYSYSLVDNQFYYEIEIGWRKEYSKKLVTVEEMQHQLQTRKIKSTDRKRIKELIKLVSK